MVCWTGIVGCHSGLSGDALEAFVRMRETEVTLNKIIFVGVLSACSNTGLVEQERSYFYMMHKTYGIEPSIHYTCMVWLLGRSDCLEEAVKLINDIPFGHSVMVWRALLGACVVHNNIEIGKLAVERVLLMELMEPQDEDAYVLLPNIYASAKCWQNVASDRKSMKRKGVKKDQAFAGLRHKIKFIISVWRIHHTLRCE
ncbi:Pentatricopeptide repeat-containing protein [Thalictrum thalictroides]|uniref:Pentatricopeptide repeat-containing protein n=1 Tax=Thalictrum thalictroides TaxID=46969 RepID=A0A7J6W555_THATH|nr:Pentatricopeptide repeat-containing protein [Thalictrum thalictroides]